MDQTSASLVCQLGRCSGHSRSYTYGELSTVFGSGFIDTDLISKHGIITHGEFPSLIAQLTYNFQSQSMLMIIMMLESGKKIPPFANSVRYTLKHN